MRTTLAVLALVLAAPEAARAWAALEADDVKRGYALLLAQSAFGRPAERAAFVVATPGRDIRFVAWRSREDFRATYKGSIPAGCIAIAHTHPTGDLYPSAQDIRVAVRLALPVVVITLQAVTVALPDGTVEIVFSGPGWQR